VAAVSSPTVAAGGRGVPGHTIVVFDGGVARGSAAVGDDGTWRTTLTLTPGQHALSAQQANPKSTSAATAAVSVTVYPTPLPPTVSAPATAARNAYVSITVSGTAGSTIRLYDGSSLIGAATIAAPGSSATFSIRFSSAGNHTVYATQSPAAGIAPVAGPGTTVRVT
jgi:hypothetical protein